MDEILTLLAGGGDDEPEWHDKALCAQTDPEAFFPEKGGSCLLYTSDAADE